MGMDMCGHVSQHVLHRNVIDLLEALRMDMCIDMGIDMHIDMCIDMCIDMRIV